MSSKSRRRRGHLFYNAAEDRIHAHQESPEKGSPAQLSSSAYKLAFDDMDFLTREELRGVRLMLELTKPELIMQEHEIEHTVVIYGSARTPSPEMMRKAEDEVCALRESRPDAPELEKKQYWLERRQEQAHYYNEARRLAAMISERSACEDCPQLHVMTGGGPGIMEAANRGASEVGAPSIGLNIVLPHEQYPNPWITPEFCFQFHYFAMRKMHFLLRARALVTFPGGFGTLDELFETLTLIQTGKIEPLPVLMFGREFWENMIDFPYMVEQGVISPADLNLFHYVETAEEAWERIRDSLQD
jgi:uncharacterized protein (TIGR00730 family)